VPKRPRSLVHTPESGLVDPIRSEFQNASDDPERPIASRATGRAEGLIARTLCYRPRAPMDGAAREVAPHTVR